ncbi:MAG: bifunctional nuclease family protein [Myxococcota bacterium]
MAVALVGLLLADIAWARPADDGRERVRRERPARERGAQERARERVEVEEVLAVSDDQFVVLLRTVAKPMRYLPIWVGESEALAIRLKLDRRHPPRPMTLNLLETVMRQGDIVLREIAIDGMRGGVFLGKIKVSRGAKRWSIDSRPSDAIGLALGKRAPIWVTKSVLNSASFDPEDLDNQTSESRPGDLGETL